MISPFLVVGGRNNPLRSFSLPLPLSFLRRDAVVSVALQLKSSASPPFFLGSRRRLVSPVLFHLDSHLAACGDARSAPCSRKEPFSPPSPSRARGTIFSPPCDGKRNSFFLQNLKPRQATSDIKQTQVPSSFPLWDPTTARYDLLSTTGSFPVSFRCNNRR